MAAVYNNKNDKIYFFKGSQFVRINPNNFTVDSDVKPIAGNWKELPPSFNEGIDGSSKQ